MIDLNHSIRLHQGADFELDPPEEPYPWVGPLLYALAGVGALGAVWCLYQAWLALP